MAKTGRKISGFLWAMLLAIISFFIIFIFFPDVSNKFFGVSLKEPAKIGETVKDAVESTTQTVTDKVTDAIVDNITNKLK
ncbi:MAG: hypothetical protein MJ057_00610 [Sphaerochaetaceae bacterium]|nr:hypothetical protein [Sphaerochaetaceae bacterium]